MIKKTCPQCKKGFFVKNCIQHRYKFCGNECRKDHTRRSRKTNCKYCNKVFYPEKRRNRKNSQFCSRECMGASYAVLDYNISYIRNSIRWLDGFMLGDGHISKNNCHLSWNVKYKQFSQFIGHAFNDYKPKKICSLIRDNRNGKFIKKFSGNSKCHPDIKKQRIRWYPNSKKIVPKDIILSKECVLMWYLGDGCKLKYGAELCTDNFSQKDVDFLISLLKKIGISCKCRNHINKPRIFIPSAATQSLFDYIGHKSPVKCYDYKFPDDTYQHRDRGYNTADRNMSKL